VASLVRRHVTLAHRLAAAVDGASDLERLAPVELSVVCFRYAAPRWTGDAARSDSLNKLLVERIQSEGRIFLTGTTLRGRYALRACVFHYGTTEADVDALVDVVRDTGARLGRRLKPRRISHRQGRAAANVSQRRTSPESSPVRNHRTRWANEPWVNDSGTT
jgi:glutamate/tyrosine decarboxylase-like PLP-dependent enzyme